MLLRHRAPNDSTPFLFDRVADADPSLDQFLTAMEWGRRHGHSGFVAIIDGRSENRPNSALVVDVSRASRGLACGSRASRARIHRGDVTNGRRRGKETDLRPEGHQ